MTAILPKSLGFLRNHKGLFFCLAIFIVSRLFYFFYLGVRFDARSLPYYWQFIDPELLRTHLLQSVFYLHSQPPLFNLFLGIILKLFPSNFPAAFSFSYIFFGILFTSAIFTAMKELGIRSYLCVALTVFFMVSPFVVEYENWLLYEYPTAVLFAGAVVFLNRFALSGRARDSFLFFLALALAIYVRGLPPIFWLFGMLACILVLNLKPWRKLLIGAAIPLVLVFALYLKQALVFGTFSVSDAFIGINSDYLVKNVLGNKVDSLISEGKISGLCRLPPFCQDFSAYASYGIFSKKTGIPVLDQTQKTNGKPNPHNILYLEAGKRSVDNGVYIFTHYPDLILAKCTRFIQKRYFQTSDRCSPYYSYKSTRWRDWRSFYKHRILLADKDGNTPIFFLGLPCMLLYGAYLFLSSIVFKKKEKSLGVVAFFLTATVFSLMVISSVAWGDLPRYRFLVDSYYLILSGLFLNGRISDIEKRVRAALSRTIREIVSREFKS